MKYSVCLLPFLLQGSVSDWMGEEGLALLSPFYLTYSKLVGS